MKFCHSITSLAAPSKSRLCVSMIAKADMSPLDFTSFGRRNVVLDPFCISSSNACNVSIMPFGDGGALNSAVPFPSMLMSCRMTDPATCFVCSFTLPRIYSMPQP